MRTRFLSVLFLIFLSTTSMGCFPGAELAVPLVAGEFGKMAVGEVIGGMAVGDKESRLNKSASNHATGQAILGSSTQGKVRLTIKEIFPPNSPDSWVKSAPWTEVIISAHNGNDDVVTISFEGIDDRGVYVKQMTGMDISQIFVSEAMEPKKEPAGMSTLGIAAMSLLDSSIAFGYSSSVTMKQMSNSQKESREHFQIVHEFEKRQINEAEVESGGTVTGSLFFTTDASLKIIVAKIKGKKPIKVAIDYGAANKASEQEADMKASPTPGADKEPPRLDTGLKRVSIPQDDFLPEKQNKPMETGEDAVDDEVGW